MKEILLEVKFAEVDRTAVSQLGVNILRNFGSNMPISVTTQQFSPFGYQNAQPDSRRTNGTTTGATPTAIYDQQLDEHRRVPAGH